MLASLVGMLAVVFFYTRDIQEYLVDDSRYESLIRAAAERNNVDSRLIRAVIFQESRFNPSVVGRAGEIGLMQVLPQGAAAEWARVHNVPPPGRGQLFGPELNIEIGSWYLARALRRWRSYRHGVELALCQYNAGESRADRWKPGKTDGAVIPRIGIESTRIYVTKIMKRYAYYCREEGK